MKKYIVLFMAVCIAAVSSSAFGVYVDKDHYSIATLNDGKPDYSDARFNYMEFSVGDTGITASADNMKLSGTLTFSGGNYSFWNGKEMQKVSGTQQTFKLGIPSWVNLGDEVEFYPLTDTGSTLRFGIEADNGFNGVTGTWNFPDMPSLNGSLTLPNFLTTAQQLENHVVYFDFIRSGENVTGLNWRVVKASDPSTALTLDFPVNFLRFRAWNFDGTRIVNLKPSCYVNPGNVAEGSFDFDSPVKESDIRRVMTKFYVYDEEADKCYNWNYFTPTEPTKMYLWTHHVSEASLVNGKSDYSGAKFSNVFFDVENANSVIAESKHLTDAGRVTVPGGGYELKDIDTEETLSTVAAGTNMTFKLKNNADATLGDDYLEYDPANDSGTRVVFAGGAETGLNGKTISWTFPAELNFNGSGVIPNYKSTSEQLASAVPYVEIVSEDGYITALNYKIVTASNTSTAITPNYRTDFNFRIYRDDSKSSWANSYNVGTVRNTASGSKTLDTPQPLSIMKRLRVRLTSYEDSADNPAVYQWNFYPAEAPAPAALTITTTTLPDAALNTPYTATLAANLTGAAWSISSGTLPAGLTLNASTGAITGTPTSAGTSSFTVRAVKNSQSAEKSFTLTVSETPTITITTASLPSGTVNTSYSATLTASIAGANWTLISGTLPAGLTLSTSGTISGTPRSAGTSTFTVRAAYSTAEAEKQFTITINPVTTLTITTASLSSGTTGQTYSATLSANISGATWSVISGNLPDGLTLSTSGTISGTPTAAGEYTFTVRAVYGSRSAEKSFTLTVTHSGTMGVDNSSSGGCESFISLSCLTVLAAFTLRKSRR